MGEPVLTPDSTEEEILEIFDKHWKFNDEDIQQEVRRVLKEGKTVYSGFVCYEMCDYDYAELYRVLWIIEFLSYL